MYVIGSSYRGDVRVIFFYSESDEWNGLPAAVVEAETMGSFKRLMDGHMELRKTEGYG